MCLCACVYIVAAPSLLAQPSTTVAQGCACVVEYVCVFARVCVCVCACVLEGGGGGDVKVCL